MSFPARLAIATSGRWIVARTSVFVSIDLGGP